MQYYVLYLFHLFFRLPRVALVWGRGILLSKWIYIYIGEILPRNANSSNDKVCSGVVGGNQFIFKYYTITHHQSYVHVRACRSTMTQERERGREWQRGLCAWYTDDGCWLWRRVLCPHTHTYTNAYAIQCLASRLWHMRACKLYGRKECIKNTLDITHMGNDGWYTPCHIHSIRSHRMYTYCHFYLHTHTHKRIITHKYIHVHP